MQEELSFLAEYRSIQSKKLITNDNEIKLTLSTSDTNALRIATYPTDVILEVTIKIKK